ncbi:MULTISPECIES: hypothetical protein [Flavobacterium]|uniref:Uncharacterized protein n=1 Tax=Flavobacterium ranwuense TaxID=2541725 RepID=A0ABY2DP26_9FLAO|nr:MULTISPECIES: hypothetical protein [Flavobacterium]TDE27930.1 hypothetical protein E0I61_12555 [Flavobacterium ranwuense]TDE53824.1 hypothetical protein E0H99_07365 [Flavobacterium sp. GT3P67]
MSLINKIGKKYFFIITTVLLLITLINYSEIKELEAIRMNNFFSGFIAGILIGLLFAGIVNYSKFKK